MAFAIKGKGVLPLTFFSKMFFFVVKKHLESFPDCQNMSCI